MKRLADEFLTDTRKKNVSVNERAIHQAARELMLAQASDWAFIMKTGTMVSYAHRRFKLHINRFFRIYNDIVNNKIDIGWLREVESRDNIFSDMDCGTRYKDKKTNRLNRLKGMQPCLTP